SRRTIPCRSGGKDTATVQRVRGFKGFRGRTAQLSSGGGRVNCEPRKPTRPPLLSRVVPPAFRPWGQASAAAPARTPGSATARPVPTPRTPAARGGPTLRSGSVPVGEQGDDGQERPAPHPNVVAEGSGAVLHVGFRTRP